jgi:hypothetical protein
MIITSKRKPKAPLLRKTPGKRNSQISKLSLPCPANRSHFCHFPRCPAAAQPSGFHRCRFDYSERS